MFENIDLNTIYSTYLVPWIINITFALIIFLVGKKVTSLMTHLLAKALQRSKMDDILVNFVSSIVRTILLLFVIIAALDRLGLDTTSLIALLGAAGIAVGLALKGSLENFSSGVMLVIFRPFKAGDFVEAAGISGVVEKIDIFNTTMKTGDNREIIIPNGSIYGGTITNYSARDTRRIDMTVGIGYDSDIRKAKSILKGLIEADERILREPETLIAVAELADSSVNFVLRPWVKSSDYWGVKFDLTEKIKISFDEEGITIPYPQMDVHLHKKD